MWRILQIIRYPIHVCFKLWRRAAAVGLVTEQREGGRPASSGTVLYRTGITG